MALGTILRIAGFVVFQVAFISLALVCSYSPLPIKLVSTSVEVRGAFSVVFVAWQFIATLLVADLLLQVFSKEWSFYLIQNPFRPGCDAVSTLTSSIFFHIKHLFTRSTSLAYKAALSALVLITILKTMGPASITTAISPQPSATDIVLAKYIQTTFDPDDHGDPVMASIQRAEVITHIEQEMKSEVGWRVMDNVLIGRQEKEVPDPNVTTVYVSDVARFDFRCEWTAFQVQQEGNALLIQANGTQWKVWNSESANDIVIGVYPLYNASRSLDGRSAYLFAGCATNETAPCLFKLNNIPSVTIPTPSQPRLAIRMPSSLLLGLLVCDPQYNITASHVVVNDTTLTIRSTSDQLPSQNIISPGTAELIFSTALLSVLSPLSASPGKPSTLSTIAGRVFLDAHGQNVQTWDDQMDFITDILDLESIQNNMGSVMLSAAKAFLIKPVGQGSNQFAGFESTTVPATIERPTILLVGSKSFIFSTIGLLGLIIFFGSLVFLGSRRQYRLPLNLQVTLRILNHGSISIPAANDAEKSPRDKPLPIILDNYHPLSPDDSSDESHDQYTSDVHWYWPRRYIFGRVVLFLILQLGFYGFAIAGHVRPYNLSQVSPVPLTEFFAELKGAFIVAFTAWHTLSIALLGDILFTIFSLEWAVQAEKKRALEPGETDRVSTLASGLFDRIKYAFTRGEGVSAMFRYALAASIVLMLLSTTGPGCLILSTTAVVPRSITIKNGNVNAAIPFLASAMEEGTLNVLERIAAISQLEQLEGFTWGYETPPNYFFPWPYYDSGDPIHEQATLKYGSWGYHLNVNCRWETPTVGDLQLQDSIQKPITSGVVPITFQNTTRTGYGHSGLLLVGCESQQQQGCVLDLTGLATRTEDNGLWRGTAALLACDPTDYNFNYAAGGVRYAYLPFCTQVTLTDNQLRLKNVTCESSSPSGVRYIGEMFASSLLYALRPPLFSGGNSTPGDVGIGLLAGQLLFDDFTATFDSTSTRSISGVQLPEVEAKMNKYLSSATKVIMAGYDPRLDTPLSSAILNITGSINATIDTTVDQMTLVGNKAMIITSMILLAIALRLLELSLRSVFWKQSRLRKLEPFGIASVARMKKWLEKEERLRNEIQNEG